MIRLGLTQRVTTGAGEERRDAVDQRWTGLLIRLGYLPVFLPNDPATVETYVDALELAGVILTGGNNLGLSPGLPDVAPERDATERRLIEACEARGLPLLGVCRGAQMLAWRHASHVAPVEGHAGTRHAIAHATQWAGSALTEVNSYHDFGLPADGLAASLGVLATAPDGTVEAFRHERYAHLGVMWHPEREPALTSADEAILREWFGGGA